MKSWLARRFVWLPLNWILFIARQIGAWCEIFFELRTQSRTVEYQKKGWLLRPLAVWAYAYRTSAILVRYIKNTASLHSCRAPSVLKDRQIRNECRCKKILKQQFIKVEHGYVYSVSTLSNLDLKRKCARGLLLKPSRLGTAQDKTTSAVTSQAPRFHR